MFRSYETSDNMILIDGNILESLNKSSIGQQLMTKIRLGFRNTRWRVVVIGAWSWSCCWRGCCCLGCLCSGSCCSCPSASGSSVDFGMSLLFIRPGKASSTDITCEWFLASMGSNMCCEVIASWKCPHTNATLKGFLTRMDPNMTS